MAIPITCIFEAAGRALSSTHLVSNERVRNNFEWAWGLGRGTLDEHVSGYTDPALVEALLDDSLILIPHSELIREIYYVVASLPWRFSSKKRIPIQDVYKGRETFEYLVLPIDPSRGGAPQTMFSCIPPHLTLTYTVDKALKHAGYSWYALKGIYKSLRKLFGQTSASGATFELDYDVFSNLRFIHQMWAIVIVPRRFLGLGGSDLAASDEEESEAEEGDDDTGSSTMEWDAQTLPDEPQRRLFPHELKQDPVFKFFAPAADEDDDDDTISCDSHITGVEDPEEYAKASMARGDYSPDRAWLKGVESWVESASGAVDDQTLLNDGQIEDGLNEPPRAATSLDLEKPDFYRIRRPVMRV